MKVNIWYSQDFSNLTSENLSLHFFCCVYLSWKGERKNLRKNNCSQVRIKKQKRKKKERIEEWICLNDYKKDFEIIQC